MKRLPLVAGLAAVGLVALLVLTRSTDPAPPRPNPPPTTAATTTTLAASSLSRWAVPPGARATSVVDLDRGRAVVRLEASRTAPGSVGIFDYLPAADRVGTTVSFSASLRVAGEGRAFLFLRALPPTPIGGHRPPDLASVVTPDADAVHAGGWASRSVTLAVPPGTGQLLFGVSLDGDGYVLVDDVVAP